ncbi:MAG: CHAT domain-containing protein, partial [Pseudomonadota bacterium]
VFATHGVVAGETSAVAPGLVLTPPAQAGLHDDGLLTAAEVATLDLSARLVILSACNTAAGRSAQDEGLSGLASGFFHAGARSLMVTHWAVYSDASAYVSSQVSKAVISGGQQSSARALRQVTMGLLDDPQGANRTKHPAYWAPFGVVGL